MQYTILAVEVTDTNNAHKLQILIQSQQPNFLARPQHIKLTFIWSERNTIFLNKNKTHIMTQDHNHSSNNIFKQRMGGAQKKKKKEDNKNQP